MDAAELIDELKRLHVRGKDIGQHLYLRRYERSRKHSAALMLAGMQGFREMFSGSHPAKKLLRDVGLKLADTLPGVKPQLIRRGDGPQRSACTVTLTASHFFHPARAPGFPSFEIF